MQVNDRTIYSFQEWKGLVGVVRPDTLVIRFGSESAAIACYREGDELYWLADGWAIIRPSSPDRISNCFGTLTTGKSYPVRDHCDIPFGLSKEDRVALGLCASLEFDGAIDE